MPDCSGWRQRGWRQQLKQISLLRQNMGSEKMEPLQDLSKSGEGDRAVVAEQTQRIAGKSGRGMTQPTPG